MWQKSHIIKTWSPTSWGVSAAWKLNVFLISTLGLHNDYFQPSPHFLHLPFRSQPVPPTCASPSADNLSTTNMRPFHEGHSVFFPLPCCKFACSRTLCSFFSLQYKRHPPHFLKISFSTAIFSHLLCQPLPWYVFLIRIYKFLVSPVIEQKLNTVKAAFPGTLPFRLPFFPSI